jgi:hypothetical protein
VTTATAGSAVALLRGVRDIIEDHVSEALTELATAYDLTLPVPASVYLGRFFDQPGVWPAVGVAQESAVFESQASPCYRVERMVVLTVSLAEGYVAAATPTTMEEACTAYCEAVARVVSKYAPDDLGAAGVFMAEIAGAVAADSPYVVTSASGEEWTVRSVRADVRIWQTVQREVV